MAIAVWIGGFTFYTAVVIHTGHKVFGSRVEVGFLTQQVTRWLNIIGVVALLVFLWNIGASWNGAGAALRWALLLTWSIVVVIQVWLFCLHPMVDSTLNAQTHFILDSEGFYHLHRLYMNLSTTQWVANLLHVFAVLFAWTRGNPGFPTR
jgi:hypothetical protein